MENLKKLEKTEVSTTFEMARKMKIMFYLKIMNRDSYLFLSIFKEQTRIQNPSKYLKESVLQKYVKAKNC